jgi:hypothetical protein
VLKLRADGELAFIWPSVVIGLLLVGHQIAAGVPHPQSPTAKPMTHQIIVRAAIGRNVLHGAGCNPRSHG